MLNLNEALLEKPMVITAQSECTCGDLGNGWQLLRGEAQL